jgi:hypothetical protein
VNSEFDSLQSARYPRVAEVRRKWKEHETLALRSGYGFLTGSGDTNP